MHNLKIGVNIQINSATIEHKNEIRVLPAPKIAPEENAYNIPTKVTFLTRLLISKSLFLGM